MRQENASEKLQKALWAAQKEKLRQKKEEQKRLREIRDAVLRCRSETGQILEGIHRSSVYAKVLASQVLGYQCISRKRTMDIRYFDLRETFKFQLDVHKFHVLRDPDTKRRYIYDIEKKFCRWYKYDDFEMYCIIKIQSVLRQYLGATRFDKIKKSKTVTPLQARARGWLLRKKTYEKKVKSTLEKVTLTHIAKEKSRITSYEDLWKVVEEPKPKKKKKFKRRV